MKHFDLHLLGKTSKEIDLLLAHTTVSFNQILSYVSIMASKFTGQLEIMYSDTYKNTLRRISVLTQKNESDYQLSDSVNITDGDVCNQEEYKKLIIH